MLNIMCMNVYVLLVFKILKRRKINFFNYNYINEINCYVFIIVVLVLR